jgi:uncharacterized membrane protein YoaK (UPF0700 family)
MSGDNMRWYEFLVIISLSTMLAFMAGIINAVTILSVAETSVSHVTGLLAKGGISLFHGGCILGTNLGLFASFVLGAFTTGLCGEGESWQIRRRYGVLMLMEAAALWLGYACYLSEAQTATMFINAFACGLQNAMGTRYSGAIVRTTHMTGAATDIGIVLGHVVRSGRKAKDAWKLKFLIPLVLFYFGGIVAGSVLFIYMDYAAITIPACSVGLVGLVYVVWRLTTQEPREAFGLEESNDMTSESGSGSVIHVMLLDEKEYEECRELVQCHDDATRASTYENPSLQQ